MRRGIEKKIDLAATELVILPPQKTKEINWDFSFLLFIALFLVFFPMDIFQYGMAAKGGKFATTFASF